MYPRKPKKPSKSLLHHLIEPEALNEVLKRADYIQAVRLNRKPGIGVGNLVAAAKNRAQHGVDLSPQSSSKVRSGVSKVPSPVG